MTRTENALARRWRPLVLACWLVALSGAVILIWARIEAETERADDVRILRAQVKAEGKTPAVPDPSQAIDELDQRTRVPVPVAGPSGPPGRPGDPGAPGPTLTPSPGATGPSGPPGRDGADSTVPGPSGSPGQPGSDSTIPGPSGPPGQNGRDGTDGTDGQDGEPPASWTWTYAGVTYTCRRVDDFDPDAPRYTCDAPEPQPTDSGGLPSPLAAGLEPTRRHYR